MLSLETEVSEASPRSKCYRVRDCSFFIAPAENCNFVEFAIRIAGIIKFLMCKQFCHLETDL